MLLDTLQIISRSVRDYQFLSWDPTIAIRHFIDHLRYTPRGRPVPLSSNINKQTWRRTFRQLDVDVVFSSPISRMKEIICQIGMSKLMVATLQGNIPFSIEHKGRGYVRHPEIKSWNLRNRPQNKTEHHLNSIWTKLPNFWVPGKGFGTWYSQNPISYRHSTPKMDVASLTSFWDKP